MCGRYYLIKRIYEVLKDMEMDVASSLQVIGDCRPHQMLPDIIQEEMCIRDRYHYIRDTVLPNLGFKYRLDHVRGKQLQKYIFQKHMLDTLKRCV